LPVNDVYHTSADTFTIKKALFEQIEKETNNESEPIIAATKSELDKVNEETQITAAKQTEARELETKVRTEEELKKPLWNTYE
jgi:hypothetical protein